MLPLAARGAELLLSPANLAPLASRRNVVVIHDSAPFRDPSWYGRAYGAWHRALLPRLARRARLVIVPSEHVRAELVELFGLPAERLRAIAPGVDPAFARRGDPAPLLRRLGLDRPYVLAVGTDSPRKNLALLDAIARGSRSDGLDVAIAGSTRAYMPGSPPGARGGSATCPTPTSRALRGRGRVRDAVALRGLRAPLRRGHGRRHAGRGRRPRGAARGLRRRGSARRPARRRRLRRGAPRAAGPERERLVAAGRERAAGLGWRRTAERGRRGARAAAATGRRP